MNVVCAHCESRLNLQEDLLGKRMRCPICHEVFTVEQATPSAVAIGPLADEIVPPDGKAPAARTDAPIPKYRSGSVADFLPLLPTEAHAEPAPVLPVRSEGNGPTELIWSEDVAPPPAPEDGAPNSAPLAIEDRQEPEETVERYTERSGNDEPIRPRRGRRPRKHSRVAVLVALLLVVAGGLATGGYFIKKYIDEAPDRTFSRAKDEYEKKNYEPARKLFEEFATKYGDDPRAPEARFFVEMCALRVAVYSVAVRLDPAPAERQLDHFLKAVEAPELERFVAPGQFNFDVAETALKLTEDLSAKGNEAFDRNQPEAAAPWLERAVAVGQVIDRFRPANLAREKIFDQLDELKRKIDEARFQIGLLAQWRQRLAEPDDTQIVSVKKDAEEHGLAADPRLTQLIDDAERKIADLVIYRRLDEPIMPVHVRSTGSTSLLFAPRLDSGPRHASAGAGTGTVFFALVRGVLYALDDDADGRVLWAARTGIDCDVLPLMIPASDLHPELAIVVANDGVSASLTACLARTGETYWHQPLPRPCIGQPVLVGQRLFAPLRDKPVPKGERPRRDETGVILEIELASGFQIGRIALGRTIGAAGVRRPGTGQIMFPAEARGVYVFDVDKVGPDGVRLGPVFLGVLPTGHAAGSLQGAPIIIPGDGESNGYLVLSFADGLEAMKLRAYPLAAPDKPPALAEQVPAPIVLNGWLSFPPYADTEKIALVTDHGQVGLFGIKQFGNLDAPIFVIPPQPIALAEADRPARGQVVYADEGNFWFLARGALHQLRLGFDFEHGLKLVGHGQPLHLGEPLHAAQVNSRLDTALVVTQASAEGACRATAIDLQSGRVRWQRQLGLTSRQGPIRIGDSILLMDQAGGLYEIEAKPLTGPVNAEWLIDARWLIDRPFANAVTAQMLPAADGKGVDAFVTTEGEKGPMLVYRHYEPGKELVSKRARLPAPLAGNPIVAGRMAVAPLANGLLYRWLLDQDKGLEAGPTWRGERVAAPAVCHLAAIDDQDFVAGDGGKSLHRWHWPEARDPNEDEFIRRGTLTLSEKLGAPPLLLVERGEKCLLVADLRGHVTLWDANKLTPNTQPLRAWRPSAKGPIPLGFLTAGPFADGDGRVGYVMDGSNLVWLTRDLEGPWRLQHVLPIQGKIVGRPQRFGDRLYITDRVGRYQIFDAQLGQPIGEPVRLSGSAAPAAAAVPLDTSKLLAPLADGTLLLLPLGAK
jgi:hypothetical protein